MFLWACAIVMVASCTIYHMQFLIIVYPTLSCCAQTAFSHCPWWITMKEMDNKPIRTITIIMTEDRFHRNFTDYHIFSTTGNDLLSSHIFNICWIHFIFYFHCVILTNGITVSVGDFGYFIGRFTIITCIQYPVEHVFFFGKK